MRVAIVGCKNERVNTFTVYIYQKAVKILSQSQAPTPLFLGLEDSAEEKELKAYLEPCFQLDLLVIMLDPDEHDSRWLLDEVPPGEDSFLPPFVTRSR